MFFFDYHKYEEMIKMQCPDTKLYAIAQGFLHGELASPNVQVIKVPLTNSVIARLLNGTDNLGDVQTESEKSSIELKNTRILVVDDIDINLMIAEETLLTYGAKVDTAASGRKAIEMLQEIDYDLVFMDHMMPEMDGVDATKIIRSLPDEKYSKLPIIALTANVVGDVKDMFLDGGMNDFVPKPLDITEIERVLMEWLPAEKWQVKTKN
jgi:CheY-like chemotaxis protein